MTVITLGVQPVYILGDVDGDGYVTPADAQLAANAVGLLIELTPDQFRRANVTGSGKLSVVDALFIGQYAEGLRDTFPAGPGAPRKPVEESKWGFWPWLVGGGIVAFLLLRGRRWS